MAVAGGLLLLFPLTALEVHAPCPTTGLTRSRSEAHRLVLGVDMDVDADFRGAFLLGHNDAGNR